MFALTRISDSDEDEDNSPNFSLDGKSVESNVGCSLRWRDRVLRARGRKRNACMVRRMQTRGEDLAQPFAGRNTVDSAVDSRTASAAFCRQEYMLSTQRSTLVQRWQETGWRRSALLAFRFFLSQLLQDARYVIHTITSCAVSCPENSAFFRKNRQFFENIPRKILHILNILEKCCILEKSRKKLVKFGENSAKLSQNLRNFGKKTEKNSAIFNENFEIN